PGPAGGGGEPRKPESVSRLSGGSGPRKSRCRWRGVGTRAAKMKSALYRGVLLGVCLAALARSAWADPQVMEVITLGYRQAEEVIPLLRPLLAPGGALTGASNQLIVRTTPANLAELKKVLAVMDSEPRQLPSSGGRA